MQRGQMGLPQREQRRRVRIPEPQAQGCSEVSGMSGMVAKGDSARFQCVPATLPDPFSKDKHDKLRQRKLPAPPPGLPHQAVQPLQSKPAHNTWSAWNTA